MIVAKALLLLVGYAVAVAGGGVAVEEVLRRVVGPADLDEIREFQRRGLRDGGRIIGWLERFLFVTFVLAGQFAALGLVLAAKGIIRYGEIKDAKDQKVAEYVLVGTMASLAWALIVALALRRLLR